MVGGGEGGTGRLTTSSVMVSYSQTDRTRGQAQPLSILSCRIRLCVWNIGDTTANACFDLTISNGYAHIALFVFSCDFGQSTAGEARRARRRKQCAFWRCRGRGSRDEAVSSTHKENDGRAVGAGGAGVGGYGGAGCIVEGYFPAAPGKGQFTVAGSWWSLTVEAPILSRQCTAILGVKILRGQLGWDKHSVYYIG